MKIKFPDLPYAYDALEPACSRKTLEFHHDKHHRKYFDETVKLIKGTKLENATLEEIVREAAEEHSDKLFNNAAQHWNHSRFWESMAPGGGGEPIGEIGLAIARDFGAYHTFRDEFLKKAEGLFGSGWVWLVQEGDALKIITTSNASTPLTTSATALLAFDVWEHAYYLDYQNRRPDFAKAFLDSLVNWSAAETALRALNKTSRKPEKEHSK